MAVSFGLHVGRSSMCLAVEKDGRCDVVANDSGDRVTPAIVAWTESETLVGLAAKQLASRKPLSVATSSKEHLLQDPDYKFKIIGEGFEKNVPVQTVHKHIYKYMQDIALSHASTDVDSKTTVITVPLETSREQKELVKECAQAAGFHVAQVVSEPAAACLAYSLGQIDQSESLTCLVYRCGGKSLTASIVDINAGMFTVKESMNESVGGDEVTELVVEHLAQEFKRKFRADPRETKRGHQKLRINAEAVKHVLSTLETANCHIESLYDGVDFSGNVSRSRFENEFSKILAKFIDPITKVLDAADLEASAIDKAIMCGGTSKIPKLQKAVASTFPKAEILTSINPDEVIAVGAATQAGLLPESEEIEKISQDENLASNGSFAVQATTFDITYVTNLAEAADQVQVLVPRHCPCPVRRSHHLELPKDMADEGQTVQVKMHLKSVAANTDLAELSLPEVKKDAKLSLSAHIHRDGSLHLALTERPSNRCAQVTIAASSS